MNTLIKFKRQQNSDTKAAEIESPEVFGEGFVELHANDAIYVVCLSDQVVTYMYVPTGFITHV